MNAFEADLKRTFAEIEEPADDGFSVTVSRRVARRGRFALAGAAGRQLAIGAASIGVAFAGYGLLSAYGADLMASFGLELARAHGALAEAGPFQPVKLLASLGGGLTQLLIAAGAAAGGLAALRATQE